MNGQARLIEMRYWPPCSLAYGKHTMLARWLLFIALLGGHSTVVLFTPKTLAPAIAGTVYVPLMFFESIGFPVFTAAESGGWPAPSLLGWVLVVLVWLAIWWGLASLLSRLLLKASPIKSR